MKQFGNFIVQDKDQFHFLPDIITEDISEISMMDKLCIFESMFGKQLAEPFLAFLKQQNYVPYMEAITPTYCVQCCGNVNSCPHQSETNDEQMCDRYEVELSLLFPALNEKDAVQQVREAIAAMGIVLGRDLPAPFKKTVHDGKTFPMVQTPAFVVEDPHELEEELEYDEEPVTLRDPTTFLNALKSA